MRHIRKEIKRRFGLGDQDDLDARLNCCKKFESKWERERQNYTNRLQALRCQFERKIEQAVGLLSGAQAMADDVKAFERDENKRRPKMPEKNK